MKQRTLFSWLYWVVFTSFVALVLAFQAVTFVRNIPPVARGSTVVFIPPNSSLREISKRLGEAGVVTQTWKFRFLTRLLRKQKLLKPGEYRMEIPSPPLTALRTLLEGKVLLHKVTLPEGGTSHDLARTLAELGLVQQDDFERLLVRQDLLAYLKIPGSSFEGFLFPDTYFVSRTDRSDRILETMVARFRQAILPEDEALATGYNFNLLQWVTFASIIEKESSVTSEHPVISSVFHNRLKKKMRLQSDPTVIYGIRDFNGNLTRKDLETDTPYNTYRRGGLPPGPIANPGASALRAAVRPAQTDYFYFVADPSTGKHVFAKSYEEHAQNVATYQLRRRASSR